MKLAVIGATGLVGREILKVLEELNVTINELILAASPQSAGLKIPYKNQEHTVVTVEDALHKQPHIALFSSGSGLSLEFAPKFAEIGCYVIDNSSAWRMNPEIPLVVPEINFESINQAKIIANPNCSTIQLVMVVNPLYRKYGLKRMIVSTYQAVTGTGKKAVDQIMAERKGEISSQMAYHYPIDFNCIPHCDVFLDNGYTKEEMKIVNESRKILGNEHLKITSTAVRVPVVGGHSESVNLTFDKEYDLQDVKTLLAETPGIIVMDNPQKNEYPMPKFAQGKNEVFVGRLRRDDSIDNALNLWIVADNLRKGAATNAVQIAIKLMEKIQK